jgi:putative hydroxymethylpyrimidine transport system permease protein
VLTAEKQPRRLGIAQEVERKDTRLWRIARSYGPAVVLVIVAIGLWELLCRALDVPHYIWPTPSLIVATMVDNASDLASNAWVTLSEVLAGFAISVAAGLSIGTLLHLSTTLRRALYPLLIASQSVPTIVLAPVFVTILGFGIGPKLAIVALFCFFPVVVGTVDGLRSVDPEYIRMMLTLDGSRSAIFRRVEFPAALPQIFTGTRVAATYAAIGAVFGEWAGAGSGLGWQMLQAKGRLDTELVFADIVIVTAMALALFGCVALAERLTIPWARGGGAMR